MIFSEFSNFFCKVHLIIFTMIPPLSLFNVSRYERRDTEKRVNKNVLMSALCHSAMDPSFTKHFQYYEPLELMWVVGRWSYWLIRVWQFFQVNRGGLRVQRDQSSFHQSSFRVPSQQLGPRNNHPLLNKINLLTFKLWS